MENRSNSRYGKIAQAFHWITAVLVVIAFAYGLGGSEERVYSPARDFGRQIHETLGLTVFALAVLRVLWKAIDRPPEPQDMPRWMMIASKSVQGALYLLLFAVPITAILGAWLEGHPLALLFGLTVQPLLGVSHDTGAILARLHTWLGDTILWLAGFHALAALYHHIVLGDGVLTTMLPSWIPWRRLK